MVRARSVTRAIAAVQDGAHPVTPAMGLDCASALSLRRKRCAALRCAALRCAAFGNNACGSTSQQVGEGYMYPSPTC